jgi:hypothetical protein
LERKRYVLFKDFLRLVPHICGRNVIEVVVKVLLMSSDKDDLKSTTKKENITTRAVLDDITTFVKKQQTKQQINIPSTAIQQIYGIQPPNSTTIPVVIKTETGEFKALDNGMICTRCGRSNHTIQQCSANKDIYNVICPPLPTLKRVRVDKDMKRIQKRHAAKEQLFQLQKKKSCALYQQGKCILGSQCNYSHDCDGYDPRSKQLCEYYRIGKCTKPNCVYSHDKKQFGCVFYFRGSCKKEECEYSHGEQGNLEEMKREMERDQKRFEERRKKICRVVE